jgi:hypothetical protein
MMKVKPFLTLSITVFLVLLLTVTAFAMSSANYRLDWFVPLSGGGGGKSNSTSYLVDFTIGQAAAGVASSSNYDVGLGYWYGIGNQPKLYLPVIIRNP